MNCFQKLLSSWRGTTKSVQEKFWRRLWIAFKNYYLRDEEQRFKVGEKQYFSCELLSKIIIFVTRNNWKVSIFLIPHVVNCFQKLLSSWRGTTNFKENPRFHGLWIAFKNYYLRDEEQQKKARTNKAQRCELLSKIIIFVTRNNTSIWLLLIIMVVNCFQKLLSSWRGTTVKISVNHRGRLWIAFKNYYLRDEEQPKSAINAYMHGCELLSKIIIFVTRNNENIPGEIAKLVVNCFQKLLSSWRGTTIVWTDNTGI